VSEWQWFRDFDREARARGDAQRARLLPLHHEAYGLRETDPDRMLALFAEGRQLARVLDEPWWVLLYDHWQVTGRLYFKHDVRHLLDLAVRNLLEVRKPAYAQFPQRLRIYNDLIATYRFTDPVGHAEQIRAALDQMEAEATPDMDSSRYLPLENRLGLALDLDRPDEALEWALRGLAQADADPDRYTARHHSVTLYVYLCLIAHERGDWPGLAEWAALGEELARQMGYQGSLAACLMWQAASACRAGDEAAARRLYRLSVARRRRLGRPPGSAYYEAQCAYHALAGNLGQALRARNEQLEGVLGRGLLAYECDVRIKRCRVLAQLGRPGDADLAGAREAARRLRYPEKPLAQIEEVASGTWGAEARE
jgi:hypothetical protein